MITNNPFLILQIQFHLFIQGFVILMILLIIIGTSLDMMHKKNVVYFFKNIQKAKNLQKLNYHQAKKHL